VSPEVLLPDAAATRAWGRRLSAVLRAGDLVVLTGGLGAGKTTLTQGIADGLSVRGPVTSPTFVLSRVHPSLVGGPALVHADAYRLTAVAAPGGSGAERTPDGSALDGAALDAAALDAAALDAAALDAAALDALDLDATLEDSVTVVEWGRALVRGLANDYLEVTLSGDGARRATLLPHGERWSCPVAALQLDALTTR